MSGAVVSESSWLQSVSPAARARFLAALAHNLTIASRVLINADAQPEEMVEYVRQVNEAQHQVTGYLAHIVGGTENVVLVPHLVTAVLGLNGSAAAGQAQQAWSFAKRACHEHEA